MITRLPQALGLLCLVFSSLVVSSSLIGQEKKGSEKALAIYEDAAEFQNNKAFELAIEEWRRLLKDYPTDPMASSAAHYLGVAYLQLETPDYESAIDAFATALKDPNLEMRNEALLNLGWCLFTKARQAQPDSPEQKKGLQEAESKLKEFLKENPRGEFTDQAQFYLGEIAYTWGDTKQAVRYYGKVIDSPEYSKSPLLPDAVYAAAVAYEERKDIRQAEKLYRRFLKDHKDHRFVPEVGVRLADLLLAKNKIDEATQILSGLPTSTSIADFVLLRLGYALSQAGRGEEAAKKYEELLAKYPNSEHARSAAVSLGQTLFNQGRYDEATQRFQTALKGQDETSADAAHWMAVGLMRQNKTDQAMKILRDAMQWAKGPTKVVLQMDFADGLYASPDKLEEARVAYEQLAEQNPDHPLASRAAYNAAFAALQTRKFPAARKWSEWFLQRFPQDPLRSDVAYIAAETLLLQGEYEASTEAYRKLRQADPKNPSRSLWTLRLAMSQYLSNDYEQVVSLLSGAMKEFEQDDRQKAEALFILGSSFLYQEDLASSVKFLRQSVSTSDSWSSADEVLLMLADAYQRNKDVAAAKETLELLLKKYPNSRFKNQAEFKLGQLSAASGQFDKAVQIYRRVAAAGGDGDNYRNFAQYGIAWSLMQQEKYEQALLELKPLLGQRSRNSIFLEAQLAEGICLRMLGKTDPAINALTRFLQASPKGLPLGNALYELGMAYTESKNLPAANEQFLRVVREVPDYPAMDRVLYELAWNYEENGDDEKSQRYFERLARDFPNSEFRAEAVYMRAQRLYESESFVEAEQAYRQVLASKLDAEMTEKARYKLGWSLFQQEKYPAAASEFSQQVRQFPAGPLAVDATFMKGECAFKSEDFNAALAIYTQARQRLEASESVAASEQVQSLIYLHGAQCYRELSEWAKCQEWLQVVLNKYPKTPYIGTTLYELAFCKQQQGKTNEALKLYSEVAGEFRSEVGARARFMMGEIYFGKRDFVKAIPEFQRVMYGFGGDRASDSVKNWQVKAAYEAARCSEVLLESLQGPGRDKVIQTAQEFYSFIVEKHAKHELAAQAQTRLGELQRLR